MIDRIGELSELEGLCESRLPVFTMKEIEWIKDTHDFFGLVFFWSYSIRAAPDDDVYPSFKADIAAEIISRFEGVSILILYLNNFFKYILWYNKG